MSETQTQDKPYEVTLGDGTVVKAPNLEEAFKTVAKMKEDTAAALREARQKYEAVEQQNQTYAQRLAEVEAANRRTETANNGGFSKDEYYRLLNQDPMAAQDYMDAYRYDIGDPSKVREVFTGVRQRVDELVQQTVTGAFLSQHYEDYPSQDVNANKVMADRYRQYVLNGLPVSVDTMNLAYTSLVNEGQIKPLEPQKQDETPNLPPTLSGSGAALSETEYQKAESMSDKELAALLKSKGMI